MYQQELTISVSSGRWDIADVDEAMGSYSTFCTTKPVKVPSICAHSSSLELPPELVPTHILDKIAAKVDHLDLEAPITRKMWCPPA